MPTRVMVGTSRPFVTRLVPTSTSSRPVARASRILVAAPRPSATSPSTPPAPCGHTPIRPGEAISGERLAHLALQALRSAAEVADSGGSAGRAAARQGRCPAAMGAAQRHAGLVVDQWTRALGAGLDRTAIPAQDDGGTERL